MAEKPIIRLGDPTSHGGTVIEAFPTLNVYGKPAAGIGHKVVCPKCKGTFPIVAGAGNYMMMGKNVALEGMKTACGAVLIATQQQAMVDDQTGRAGSVAASSNISAKPSAANALVAAAARTDDPSKWIKFKLEEAGTCEGLKCTVHFDDGSKMKGVFDSSNLLSFANPTGMKASRLEFEPSNADSGNSVTQTFLNLISG